MDWSPRNVNGVIFPPALVINITLTEGSVYYFKNQSFDSKDFHYYVVLNFYPENDEQIIMVNATSKIDSGKERVLKRGFSESSFVVVRPSDYDELKYDSGFDCNEITLRSVSQLIKMLEDGELMCKKKMPIGILNKLRNEVSSSGKVENWIRKQFIDN